MESVLGPILLGHNGEGINRVHFLDSLTRHRNWKIGRKPAEIHYFKKPANN